MIGRIFLIAVITAVAVSPSYSQRHGHGHNGHGHNATTCEVRKFIQCLMKSGMTDCRIEFIQPCLQYSECPMDLLKDQIAKICYNGGRIVSAGNQLTIKTGMLVATALFYTLF
ncbi:hypothetical protein Ahia01_000123500 [Argonauta hians]